MRENETDIVTFTADMAGPGSLDLGSGNVYKDGATTGWTVWEVAGEETFCFSKKTAIYVENPQEVHRANIIQAKVTTIGKVGKKDFAKPGDSGSCCLRVIYWVGIMVSLFFRRLTGGLSSWDPIESDSTLAEG